MYSTVFSIGKEWKEKETKKKREYDEVTHRHGRNNARNDPYPKIVTPHTFCDKSVSQ